MATPTLPPPPSPLADEGVALPEAAIAEPLTLTAVEAPEPSSDDFDLVVIVAASAAGGGVAVLLLLVAVVCACRRQHASKNRVVWEAGGPAATSPPIAAPRIVIEGTEIDVNDAPLAAAARRPPPVGMPHTPPGGGGDRDDPRVAQLEWLQKSCAARMRKDAEELQQLEAQIAAMRPALAVSRDDSCDSCDERAEDDGPQSPVGSMLRFSQIALGTRGRMMSYRV